MPISSPQLKTQIFRAGAGAGKTTKLVSHVIETAQVLKRIHGRVPRIIVTTFTRKATQELRERLLIKGQEIQDPEIFQFLLSKRDLHISTIHGVLYSYLARYGSVMGLDPGFQLVSSEDFFRKAKGLVRRAAESNSTMAGLVSVMGYHKLTESLVWLNRLKREHPLARFPSSDELIHELRSEYQKLTQQTQDLVERIQSETSNEKWLSFSQALGPLVEILKKGPSQRVKAIDFLDELSKPTFTKAKPPVSEETKELLDQVFERLKSLDSGEWSLECLEFLGRTYADLETVEKEFEKLLAESRVMGGEVEVADLELLALQLIRDYPDTARQFSEEWDYWLIDEYQDTSPIQVELMKKLRGQRPYFVVGDPQQSIYFFRGARSEVFSREEKEIRDNGGVVDKLMTNYRSTPALLQFINKTVEGLGPTFESMAPDSSVAHDPSECVAIYGAATSDTEENEFLAQQVAALLNSGVSAEKICFLARKNKTLKEIADHLESYGIPTQVHAAGGFSERREILDALSILKFLLTPQDQRNLVRLLRSPWFYFDQSELAKICGSSHGILWDELKKIDRPVIHSLMQALDRVEAVGYLKAFEETLVTCGLIDYSHLHDSTGQRESNLWKLVTDLKSQSRLPNFNPSRFIHQLGRAMDLEKAEGDGDAVPAFEPNRVNFMTIHASKGLQFDYVFLPRIGSKSLGSSQVSRYFSEKTLRIYCGFQPPGESKSVIPLGHEEVKGELRSQEEAETLRLFYVALTRAKRQVVLSRGKHEFKDSWLHRVQWPAAEGVHVTPGFQFRLMVPPFQLPALKELSSRQKTTVRAAFGQKTQDFESVSVSELISGPDSIKQRSAERSLIEGLERANRGVLVHRALEALHYNPDHLSSDTLTEIIGDRELSQQLMNFVQKEKRIPLFELIRRGHVEYGFLTKVRESLIEGQIDLWGDLDGQVWVVDYKTGSSAYLEKAFEQLKLYAYALWRGRRASKVKLAVVFPFDDEVHVREFSDFKNYEGTLTGQLGR